MTYRAFTVRALRLNYPRSHTLDFHPLPSTLRTFFSYPFKFAYWVLRLSAAYRKYERRIFLDRARDLARLRMWENFGKNAGQEVMDGAVVASPSDGTIGNEPDYWYTWTRDSALVCKHFMHALTTPGHPDAIRSAQAMRDYVTANETMVRTPNLSGTWQTEGLGEPKFNVDGSAFEETWGRPQNDGPPLRAIVLCAYAEHLLDKKSGERSKEDLFMLDRLFNDVVEPGPAQGLIKLDCDYITKVWEKDSFDLWEEVSTKSFFTLAAQRRALNDAALLAKRLGKDKIAQNYFETADKIVKLMRSCYDGNTGQILCAAKPEEFNRSGIDASVFLAILHAGLRTSAGEFVLHDEHVLRSLYEYETAFRGMYKINEGRSGAPCCGRYPEDIYDGNGTSNGNPWFLTIAGMAQCMYMISQSFKRETIIVSQINAPFFQKFDSSVKEGDKIQHSEIRHKNLISRIFEHGDSYLDLIQEYGGDMTLSEQIDGKTGQKMGAISLTWSHAAMISAIAARDGHTQALDDTEGTA